MTELPSLRLEQFIDQSLGRLLSREREVAGFTIDSFAYTSGLPAQELQDHEEGLLPIPASRLPVLIATLAGQPGALLVECLHIITRPPANTR